MLLAVVGWLQEDSLMTAPQFQHLGLFGREPMKGAKRWETVGGIVGEVTRAKGCHPHIKSPATPKILFGCSPHEVGAAATMLSLQARDSCGRRLRRDGRVLVAGVVTYPMPRVDLEHCAIERDIYENWKAETLGWLIERSGIAIQCVIEHSDEEHMNIHYFALPTLMADLRLNFDTVHPGRRARDAAAKKPGVQLAAVQAAYQGAMSEWQDRFFNEVSVRFGHERFGPRRKRVTRDRHKALRQVQREEAAMRAAIELENRLAVTSEDAESFTRKVNQDDFAAAALAMIRKLTKELAEKNERLREIGFVDPDDFPLPPAPDQIMPIVPAIASSTALAVFDEFDYFPESPSAPGPEATPEWKEFAARMGVRADELQSVMKKRQVDPHAPECEGVLFRPKNGSG
jgi:hypothetical protein